MRFFLLLFIFLIVSSCKREKSQKSVGTSEFEFFIEGSVKGGEGVELALYIPSQGMDKRLKSKINNGRYHFKGKMKSIEVAKIVFEEDMNRSSNYWSIPVFLEPTSIHLNFTIYGDSLDRRTKDNIIIEPSNSKYLYDIETIVFKEFSTMPRFKNEKEKDSLYKNVYPYTKEMILNAIDSLFDNQHYDATALFVLNNVINNSTPFDYHHISYSENEKINHLFKKIDTTFLYKTPDYKEFKNKLKNIILSNETIVFKDFILPNIKNKDIKLSEIIKNNKYTVLDFWWSGCSPCRIFNKEITLARRQELKENGIEIVSINVDNSIKRWKQSSKIDGISWINLFAGEKSEIVLKYKIQYYPTKIIFDNKFNVVDIKFNKIEELIKLLD